MNKSANIAPGRVAAPDLPSLARYRDLFLRDKMQSITRVLQYEALRHQEPAGRMLDVGGGKRSSYLPLIMFDEYESINIVEALEPTWVVGIGEAFPCPADSYDTALSMNTFEHVFDAQFLVDQMYRALKPGGRFMTAVPFLYPVHGSPDDFFRPTPSWFFHALSRSGFSDIVVKPLVWGPFSTGYVCSGAPGPLKGLRRHATLLTDLGLTSLMRSRRDASAVSNNLSKLAVSHFVTARK